MLRITKTSNNSPSHAPTPREGCVDAGVASAEADQFRPVKVLAETLLGSRKIARSMLMCKCVEKRE